jgi:adenylate cyclase
MKSTRSQRVQRRHNLSTLGANILGALLVSLYLNLQADSLQVFAYASFLELALSGLLLIVLLTVGSVVWHRIMAPMQRWYGKAAAGDKVEAPSLQVRQLMLNNPLLTAGISLGMWLLAGVCLGLLHSRDLPTQPVDWGKFGQIMMGAGGLSGLTTATVIYFAVERVWRGEMGLFFPAGNLSETPAFRVTVRRRLLILIVMVTLPLLLLAILSYTHATQIASATQPEALLTTLRNLELFIVGVGVLTAVALARTLGASLAEPLEIFSRKMASVQTGSLEGRMEVTSNDELGALAEGYNAMVDGLRREEVIRRLFGHYVTPQVAEHAIQHGADLGGEYAEATVLFTDIRGFTRLTEEMAPEVLIALLNRYFQTISSVVVEHGGLVTRLGGDSLLAVFGTPLNPAEDHAHRAVQAAWGLMPALAAFNQAQVRQGEPTLRTGVGVATGPVLAGNVGSEERLEYTVLGEAVNLASRLEAMTKEVEAQILLSEETARAVESWAPLQPMGQVEVRGMGAPQRVYALKEA